MDGEGDLRIRTVGTYKDALKAYEFSRWPTNSWGIEVAEQAKATFLRAMLAELER